MHYRFLHLDTFFGGVEMRAMNAPHHLQAHFPNAATQLTTNVNDGRDDDVINQIANLSKQAKTPAHAKALLYFLQDWDPHHQFPEFDDLRDKFRSKLFHSPQCEFYAETIVGNEKKFSLTDQDGTNYMAGITKLAYSKPWGNEDAMAIAKASDGTVYTAVADGVGSGLFSKIASEFYSGIIVAEMAKGHDILTAGKFASWELSRNHPRILTLAIFKIVFETIRNLCDSPAPINKDKFLETIETALKHNLNLSSKTTEKILEQTQIFFDANSADGNLKPVLSILTYKSLAELIQKLLHDIEKKDRFNFDVEPSTTLVVTESTTLGQSRAIRIHSLGDSGAALYKASNGRYHLIGQKKPQSPIQVLLDDGYFDQLVECMLLANDLDPSKLTKGEIREKAQFLARNHPNSNIVHNTVDLRGTPFKSRQGMPDKVSSTKWIPLETGQKYVLICYTDRLSDSVDLKDLAQDLTDKNTASDMLDQILERIEHNNSVAQEQIQNKFATADMMLDEILMMDKWRQFVTNWMNSYRQERQFFPVVRFEEPSKRPQLTMSPNKFKELKNDLIDAGVDPYLVNNHLVPFLDGKGMVLLPYFAIDGGKYDDTTVIVEIIDG